ncbi:MAG: hypothetical protein WCK84_10175, partial [Bacteroidota bacterium]
MKIFLFSTILMLFFCMTNAGVCSQLSTVALARQAYIIALHERSMHRIISALILTGDAYKKNNIDS